MEWTCTKIEKDKITNKIWEWVWKYRHKRWKPRETWRDEVIKALKEQQRKMEWKLGIGQCCNMFQAWFYRFHPNIAKHTIQYSRASSVMQTFSRKNEWMNVATNYPALLWVGGYASAFIYSNQITCAQNWMTEGNIIWKKSWKYPVKNLTQWTTENKKFQKWSNWDLSMHKRLLNEFCSKTYELRQ